MTQTHWTCAGCGKPSPDRVRSCDCPTNVVSRAGGKTEWKRPDDPLIFQPQPSGREEVLLGRVTVAEIAPAAMPGRHSHSYRIMLPGSGVTAFQPARDLDVARFQVRRRVNDWLNAADLRPNG